MKIKFILVFISFWITIFIFSSCTHSENTENALTSGIIEFNSSVVDQSHPMATLAPNSATLKFKENKVLVEMSTMGFFTTIFISNPEKKTLTHIVKIMDIKDACVHNEADLIKDNADYELKFEETKETKKIAGYLCKKVRATKIKDPTSSFDVYYTEELGTEGINNLGPYKSIKGMLMEYRMKKMEMEINFSATAVKKAEVKDEDFEIPAGFKMVTAEEMKAIFKDFLN